MSTSILTGIGSNPILNTDSYKASHYLQFPPDTKAIGSYVESRGGRFAQTLFFGLQIFLREYLDRPVTAAMIDEAEAFFSAHMPGSPFNRAGWEYLVRHRGGRFPLELRAVPEGHVVPIGNALVTVESTDPRLPWIGQYLETALLRALWYPVTVATLSWHIKALLRRALARTADTTDGLAFMLHDFGARGVSSLESAMIGGAAHLVSFQGSDNVAAAAAANRWYDAPMSAYSIPAAEHSTITAWGEAGELDAYRNMLSRFARPGGLLAVVSDSYDLERALHWWGSDLREQVRASGATVVVRPDSGHPPTIVRRALDLLAEGYGTTTNGKGYRVLRDVRVIQGDGVDFESIGEILTETERAGFSAENLAFGMGGALLQRLHRDTQRFALKASAIKRDDQWQDVRKTPKTDPGKASKGGRLTLLQGAPANRWRTQRRGEPVPRGWAPALQLVYRDGQILRQDSLSSVRQRADAALEAYAAELRLGDDGRGADKP